MTDKLDLLADACHAIMPEDMEIELCRKQYYVTRHGERFEKGHPSILQALCYAHFLDGLLAAPALMVGKGKSQ